MLENENVPMVNNLKFKTVEYRECMGKLYAFVTCIDVQSNGRGTALKGYWGEVLDRNSVDDIHAVMSYGAKWEHLPTCPY